MKKSVNSVSVEPPSLVAMISKEPVRVNSVPAELKVVKPYPKGHLLCVDRGVYDHVGISDGKGYVYENSYRRNGRGKVSYDEFSGGMPIIDLGILQGSCHPDTMISRAEKLIQDKKKYNLLFNNCEHFVREVCDVNVRSPQVQKAIVSTISAAIAFKFKHPALKGFACGAAIGALLKNNSNEVIKNSLSGASFGLLIGLILSYKINKNESNGADVITQEANLHKECGRNKLTSLHRMIVRLQGATTGA